MKNRYNTETFKVHETRLAGRKLARKSGLADNRCGQMGKTLSVVSFPQGGERVPSIRVAGKWLGRFGFEVGDSVILRANIDQISITKKEES